MGAGLSWALWGADSTLGPYTLDARRTLPQCDNHTCPQTQPLILPQGSKGAAGNGTGEHSGLGAVKGSAAHFGVPGAPAPGGHSREPLPLPNASHPDSKSPDWAHHLGGSQKVTDTAAPEGEQTVTFHLPYFLKNR